MLLGDLLGSSPVSSGQLLTLWCSLGLKRTPFRMRRKRAHQLQLSGRQIRAKYGPVEFSHKDTYMVWKWPKNMLIASPLWENYDECPLNYSYNFTFTAIHSLNEFSNQHQVSGINKKFPMKQIRSFRSRIEVDLTQSGLRQFNVNFYVNSTSI